jgi:hypothetical protein
MFYLSMLKIIQYNKNIDKIFIVVFKVHVYLFNVVSHKISNPSISVATVKIYCVLNLISTFYYYLWVDTSAGGLLVP